MTTNSHRVLILCTRDWFGSARLPAALQRAGFRVASLNFPGGLISHSRNVDVRYSLPEAASDAELLSVLANTLEHFAPEFVIPGDDPAVELLHGLACRLENSTSEASEAVACLRRSLGDSRHYSSVQSRERLHQLAERVGVRVPGQRVVTSVAAAVQFAEEYRFPVVLKVENSCAGFGTQICGDEAAIARAFGYLLTRFQGKEGSVPALTAQRYISGRVAMRALVALEGKVVAGLSALKLETHPAPTGPSTVVEFIDHGEMSRFAETVTEAFGLAGFASFDFILEGSSDAAYLIELNPRVTPICHLGGTFGPDLCGGLWQRLTGLPPLATLAPRAERTVALFPQEWIRNRESPYLGHAYHDVPWEDPGLCQALVANAREQMGWTQLRREEGRRESVRVLRAP